MTRWLQALLFCLSLAGASLAFAGNVVPRDSLAETRVGRARCLGVLLSPQVVLVPVGCVLGSATAEVRFENELIPGRVIVESSAESGGRILLDRVPAKGKPVVFGSLPNTGDSIRVLSETWEGIPTVVKEAEGSAFSVRRPSGDAKLPWTTLAFDEQGAFLGFCAPEWASLGCKTFDSREMAPETGIVWGSWVPVVYFRGSTGFNSALASKSNFEFDLGLGFGLNVLPNTLLLADALPGFSEHGSLHVNKGVGGLFTVESHSGFDGRSIVGKGYVGMRWLSWEESPRWGSRRVLELGLLSNALYVPLRVSVYLDGGVRGFFVGLDTLAL